MTSPADHAPDGVTVLEVLRDLEAEGYTGQIAAGGGGVRCITCGSLSPSAEVHVDRICRTEGTSDPADMVAVAAVRCPRCATRGTVALKYGPGASPEESEILAHLDDSDRQRAQNPAEV